MGEIYRAKMFKSGNSVALRVPKALGLAEGDEVIVTTHDDGSFSLWPEKNGAAVLDSLFGAFSDGFMSQGRGEIEQEERDWNGTARPAAA